MGRFERRAGTRDLNAIIIAGSSNPAHSEEDDVARASHDVTSGSACFMKWWLFAAATGEVSVIHPHASSEPACGRSRGCPRLDPVSAKR